MSSRTGAGSGSACGGGANGSTIGGSSLITRVRRGRPAAGSATDSGAALRSFLVYFRSASAVRQEVHRAETAVAQSNGTRSQGSTRDISNADTRYSETIQHMAVNNAAPVRFMDATSDSAATVPSCPPAGIAPAIGFQSGPRPSAAQVDTISVIAPKIFAQGVSMADDRIHFQPSSSVRIGIAYAASPKA